jgi:hypothetical protein
VASAHEDGSAKPAGAAGDWRQTESSRPATGLTNFERSGSDIEVTAIGGVEQSDRSPMTMPGADLLFFSHGYLAVLRRRASRGIRGSAVGFGIAAAVWAVSASLTGRAACQRGDVFCGLRNRKRREETAAVGVAQRLSWAPIRFLMSDEAGAWHARRRPLFAMTEMKPVALG